MKPGMIKVSALYPNQEGKKFDMDYYCNKHLPMVMELGAGAIKHGAVEKGLGGTMPGTAPEFVAAGHMYFDSMEEFQQMFGQHAEQIMGDVPNYTDIEPVMLVSEVTV